MTIKLGIGWLAILPLIALFIILKLTGVVGWSWWWVLSPLIGVPLAVGSAVAIALLIVRYRHA